jgi:hypothetical protein
MKTPERSAALAQALNLETVGLPDDFAAKVATLAESRSTARSVSWNVGLLGAFVAMLGICVAGWIGFSEESPGGPEWLADIIGTLVAALAPHPWLAIGMAGIAFVQVLTFRQRTTITP